MEAAVQPALTPAAQTSLDEALAALFTVAVNALNARRCSLYLRAPNSTSLRLHSDTGQASRAEAVSVSLEGNVVGLVTRTQVPLLVRDVAGCPSLPTHPERYATASFVSVPILVEYETAGVLSAADRRDSRPFAERDLETAEMIGHAMSAVLHSHALARRVLDESEVDPITGLYNRRHLEKRLAQEVVRALRAGAPLSLLLLGVDYYERMAARNRVQAAGALMRCIGEMIGHIVRRSDLVLRYGTDELAVLLPATVPERAWRVARTITRDITHARLPEHLRYDCEKLDLSVGMACLGVPATGAELLRRAEEALRQARRRDGAAVVAAKDEVSELSRLAPTPDDEEAVSGSLHLGIPYLADPATAATVPAIGLLPLEVARMYVCLPIAFEAGTLTLAMAEPGDARAIHAVSQLTGMAVCPVASPPGRIREAIATLLGESRLCCDAAVRIHIPAVADANAFVPQVERLASILDACSVGGLEVEGTITALPSAGVDRETLLAELAANADLPLHPDEHTHGLFHLAAALDNAGPQPDS